MQIPKEGEAIKPIRVIEYGGMVQIPMAFRRQAHDIFWEPVGHSSVVSAFSRNLARKYLKECAEIPEDMSPMDRNLRFYFFGLIANPLTLQLSHTLCAANGKIEGKRILDLGCGSTASGEKYDFEHFQPWLCRALAELGGIPVGVDIGDLDGEKFEAHGKVDLLEENSLSFIPDSSVDVVHSRALFTSPRLYDDSKERYGSGLDYQDQLMKILHPQITRVLKPDGSFVLSKGL